MAIQEEFEKLVDRLKTERDGLSLKMHLASMEVRQEFEEAEKTWKQLKTKAGTLAEGAVEITDEYLEKAKIVGEELEQAYRRIAGRLRK